MRKKIYNKVLLFHPIHIIISTGLLRIYQHILCISFIFIAMFLVGCETYVDIDLLSSKLKPVVYAYAPNGEPMSVFIYQNFPIDEQVEENRLVIIKNADINLYVNGNYKEKLLFNNKSYNSDYIPKTYDQLKIVAPFQTNDTITADAIVPDKTHLNNVEFIKNGFIDNEGFTNDLVKFEFNDPIDTENFYEIYIAFTVETDSTINTYKPYYYYSNNPIIENEDQLVYEPRSILFSDKLFNGKTAFIDIAFEGYYLNNDEKITQTRLVFMSISKEYYLYKKSYYKQLYNNNPGYFWNAQAEPSSVYSNIENGYGIFSAYALSSVILKEK